MSKIAIISQPDQGVLIDLSGCESLQEAGHHLMSTLQVPSGFWTGMDLDINLGSLELSPEEVAQLLALASEAGVVPKQVFCTNQTTQQSLHELQVKIGKDSKISTATTGAVISDVSRIQHATDNAEIRGVAVALSELATKDMPQGIKITAGQSPEKPSILYFRQTLRSGQSVSHKGHLVIIGDVNPGAEVVAEGDIIVWGNLRGVAHAGSAGNTDAEIRALRLDAIQLRIAHAIARAPDRKAGGYGAGGPERAHIVHGTIHIAADSPD